MKRFYKILLIIAAFLLIPKVVYAANEDRDSEGNNGGNGISIPCGDACKNKYTRSGKNGGVRITFVDENGLVVQESGGKSYDFITYSSAPNQSFTFNGFAGDRSKFALANGANYTATTKKAAEMPLFSEVVAKFNSHTSTPRRDINSSGYTGGNLNAKYTKETKFFISITSPTNANYIEDVNAFTRAIAEVTGGFKADDMIYKIAEGCNGGQQIFIIMEPLFLWAYKTSSGTYTDHLFATYADLYYMVGDISKFQNINGNLYQIYYKDEIAAFKAAVGISENSFKIQNTQELLSNAGFGLAVDWATNSTAGCNPCTFIDGKFSYDNKIEGIDMVIPEKFANVAEYAFTKLEEGGAGCCKLLENDIADKPAIWQTAYDKLCDDEPECCKPNVPNGPPVIDVNNCCSESPESKVKEPELNDLFCYDSELNVTYYKDRCNNDLYKDTIDGNDYCVLYCTERVQMEVPGAVSGVSGNYFKLDKVTSRGTNTPFIEGYRRCRVKVFYQDWRDDYVTQVTNQVTEFNKFQMNAAYTEIYESASKTATISESGTITVTCKGKDDAGKDEEKTSTASYSYSYDVYTFSKTTKKYAQVELDNTPYTKVTIKSAASGEAKHNKYAYPGITAAKTSFDNAVKSAVDSCKYTGGTADVEFKYPDGYDSTAPDEKPTEVLATYKGARNSANSNFVTAVNSAYNLENKLDQCNYYFKKDEAQRATSGLKYIDKNNKDELKNFYKFDPDLGFRYTQIYVNKETQKEFGTVPVEFDKTCTYEMSYAPDNEDGLIPNQYSTAYGSGNDSIKDFKKMDGLPQLETISMASYYDEEYKSDKRLTTDAKVHADCTWKEKEEEIITFVPSGRTLLGSELASHVTSNITRHKYKYQIDLNTFSGVYSTYWDVKMIGHEGKLTDYFKNGRTCAAENVSDLGLPDKATTIGCKIYVKNRIVQVGYCEGSNGTEVALDPENCPDPPKGHPQNFSFKISDSNKLFPTNPTDYAANWLVSEVGKSALEEIQQRADEGKTYAPERISYQFNLDSTTLKYIKKYNTEQNKTGGYADFNLTCTCPKDEDGKDLVQTTPTEGTKGCNKCYSKFLTNINNIRFDNRDHEVNAWTNPNRNITTLRLQDPGQSHIHWSEA